MPSIDRESRVPFYLQIYEQVANGIELGTYPSGKKLPSIRECARELGVSNTTIELAYQRLVDEGLVKARRGSGFTICEIEAKPVEDNERFTVEYRQALSQLESELDHAPGNAGIAYDFAYDSVDGSAFPFASWAKICREVFFRNGAEAACLYNDIQGLDSLRAQIAKYVNGEYGLSCTAGQIAVMPTTRDLVSSVITLFEPAKTRIAMENPGYDEVATALEQQGFDMTSIPTFPFPTWSELHRQLAGVDIVFATPACQFPSNTPMPHGMRRQLVAWAERNGAYLIDDEYGWEYQGGVGRAPSLGVFDRTGHVITLGTFSNSFTPAACLSYAVLPPQLMIKWRRKQRDAHPKTPWQTQAAMAAFMEDGHWRSHVRRIRTLEKKKRQVLAKAIEKHMGAAVETRIGISSLFALVQTRDGRAEDELIAAAERAGVRVYPTLRYWRGAAPDSWRYVLVGYAGIAIDDIEPGIEALATAWGF